MPKKIDQLIYFTSKNNILPKLEIKFNEEDSKVISNSNNNKLHFNLEINCQKVYISNVFYNVHLMKNISHYNSPVIGDCFTKKTKRGLSIYPYMLQQTATSLLKNNEEVFVLVSPKNLPSIKGIEKAGFELFCKFKATRIGPFYFSKEIKKTHLWPRNIGRTIIISKMK